MYILNMKLKIIKTNLKDLNKNVFGSVMDNVSLTQKNLKYIQHQINTIGHSELLVDQQRGVELKLNQALNLEEIFQKDKAKIKWHDGGDRNTKFFPMMVKVKNATMLIYYLKVENHVVTNNDQIVRHVVGYYKNLCNDYSIFQDFNLVDEVIPNLINDQTNALLTILPSMEEIDMAIFNNHLNIIKEVSYQETLQFLKNGWILPN